MVRFVSASLAAVFFSSSAVAQTELARFFPPVVGAGQESVVKAEGKFENWPPRVHCSRDDIAVEAAEESGELNVSVPAEAVPGVAWIRLVDDKAASGLTPLLIDAVRPEAEQESNNAADDTAKIELPATLYGRLEKRNDVDMFRVAVKAGDRLVITCTANQILQSPMDAVMQLADLDGNVLAQADDVRGLDPQLVYDASEDRELIVRLFAFPETPNSTIGFDGSSGHVYVLQMTTGPYVDHSLPLVGAPDQLAEGKVFGMNLPFDQPQYLQATYGRYDAAFRWQAWRPEPLHASREYASVSCDGTSTSPVELPGVCTGHLSQPGEKDRFRFFAAADGPYEVTVHAREFGFPTDSVIEVFDGKSDERVERNDDASRSDYDAALMFNPKTDGEYELHVSDLVDGAGLQQAYTVSLGKAVPSAELTLSADHFRLEPGKPLEIPVTIDRRHGFDKPVEISIEGLPASIKSEAVTSEAKGDSAKGVKLKLTHDGETAFSGTIHIVGRVKGEGADEREPLIATYGLRAHVTITDMWLTAVGK